VPPSDELVVAAVARAVRHEATYHGASDCAYLRDVADHLGFPWHSHTSRRLTPIMERLVERGLVWYERSTHGTGWAVTEDGAELAAKVEGLPESPQHREWRSAREWFTDHMPELRERLSALAAELVDVGAKIDDVSVDDMFRLSQRVKRAAIRLAVTQHCLERPEPDDTCPDTDDLVIGIDCRVSWTHFFSMDKSRREQVEVSSA